MIKPRPLHRYLIGTEGYALSFVWGKDVTEKHYAAILPLSLEEAQERVRANNPNIIYELVPVRKIKK